MKGIFEILEIIELKSPIPDKAKNYVKEKLLNSNKIDIYLNGLGNLSVYRQLI